MNKKELHRKNQIAKLQKEFEYNLSDNSRIVSRTEITNDSAANWLRIGGYGYTNDYVEKMTEEELNTGKTIVAYPYKNIVFWVAE